MNRTLAFLLLAIVTRVQATVVNYGEGSYTVPDEMRELAAEEIKELWPEAWQIEQVRAFLHDYPDKSADMIVISGVLPAPRSLCSFTALSDAAKDLEKTREEFQKEVQRGLGSQALESKVTDFQIDLANQQITASVEYRQNGANYKCRTCEVPANDRRLLYTIAIVERASFDKLLPTIEKIGHSLKAYQEFRLSQDPGWGFLTGFFVFTAPALWAFFRRKESRWRILWVGFLAQMVVFVGAGLTGYFALLFPLLCPVCSMVVMAWAMFDRVEGEVPTAVPSWTESVRVALSTLADNSQQPDQDYRRQPFSGSFFGSTEKAAMKSVGKWLPPADWSQIADATVKNSKFDVSATACLREKLGGAAASLKLMGILSAGNVVALAVVSAYAYHNYAGAGIALVGGPLLLWCTCRVAKGLRSGSRLAVVLAAAWCGLWTAVALFVLLPQQVLRGEYHIFTAVGLVVYSAPIYFLVRGLLAFRAHGAYLATGPDKADPLALHPWEEALRIKKRPKFLNKRNLVAYDFLVSSVLPLVLFTFGILNGKGSYSDYEWDGVILSWGLGYLAVSYWVARIYRHSRRLAMLRGGEAAMKDKRPIVLYLRSFRDDTGIRMRARATDGRILLETLLKISFEELVADHLWRYGPVLAISDPQARETFLPLGAARERATDTSWQEKVTDLMRQASMIVATAGETQGLLWEIDRIVSLGLLSKLVLLLPPVTMAQLKERWRFLTSNVLSVELASEINLPWTRAVIFPEGHAALITANKRDDWTYEAVLDAAALIIVEGNSAHLP